MVPILMEKRVGKTPISLTQLREHHLDAVKWLAEKGAYVHSVNSKGVTARSIA